MKTLCIGIVFFFSWVISDAQPMRDLTVGNKFVYSQFFSYRIGDTVRHYYEQVVRDTLIQGKTYAVVYRSYDKTISLERSDDTTVYVYSRGKEVPRFRWNAQVGDSVNINMWGLGCDTCMYPISRFRPGFPENDGFTADIDIPNWDGRSALYVLYYKKFGVYQFQQTSSAPFKLFENVIQRGSTIRGVTLGDTTTNTRVVSVEQQPFQAAAVFSSKAPNPFSETVSLDFSLDVSAAISLEVVNTKGQVVAVFPQGTLGQGKHTFRWNGKTNDGSDTEQGAYLVRMVVNGKNTDTAKLMKVR
jgi:hypothetical protein